MARLNSIQETGLRDRITYLKEQLEVEKQVKDKIESFINRKKTEIENMADERDKLREKRLEEMLNHKEEILT